MRKLATLVMLAALPASSFEGELQQAAAAAGAAAQASRAQAAEAIALGEALKAAGQARAALISSVEKAVVQVNLRSSLGSGFFVDASGIIVTNEHVIARVGVGGPVSILLSDEKTSVPGRVVAASADKDLAIVLIDPAKVPDALKGPDGKLVVLPLGDSKALRKGDLVFAIGAPVGLTQTVSAGVVSGPSRRWDPMSVYVDLVQTDAAINPGNSGGPLINAAGELVGVNSMGLFLAGGGSNGLNFAISAEDVRRALVQYSRVKHLETAKLGAIVNMTRRALHPTGTLVERVRWGSAASKGGIQAGDVIVEFDGVKLADRPDFDPTKPRMGIADIPPTPETSLARLLGARCPGDQVAVVVRRGGQLFPLKVVLD